MGGHGYRSGTPCWSHGEAPSVKGPVPLNPQTTFNMTRPPAPTIPDKGPVFAAPMDSPAIGAGAPELT